MKFCPRKGKGKGTGKGVPLHALEAYGEVKLYITPLIFILDVRWSIMLWPSYFRGKRFLYFYEDGWTSEPFRIFGGEANLWSHPGTEPQFLGRSAVSRLR